MSGVVASPGGPDHGSLPRSEVVEGPLGIVAVRVEYATFARRLWALVLDVVLFAIVALMLRGIMHDHWAGSLLTLLGLLWFVGATAEGGTIGKRLLSLRVVRVDGTRVSVARAFLREPIGKLVSALALFGGFFWMLDQPQRRCWHDLMAGTVVVRELRAGAPTWAAAPPWQAGRVQREVTVPAATTAGTRGRGGDCAAGHG